MSAHVAKTPPPTSLPCQRYWTSLRSECKKCKDKMKCPMYLAYWKKHQKLMRRWKRPWKSFVKIVPASRSLWIASPLHQHFENMFATSKLLVPSLRDKPYVNVPLRCKLGFHNEKCMAKPVVPADVFLCLRCGAVFSEYVGSLFDYPANFKRIFMGYGNIRVVSTWKRKNVKKSAIKMMLMPV